MKTMINKLKPKSEFSRNVLTLMTGTTIAQAIPIAISPILTRIYTPEDFGILALFLSLAGMISIIATARYELAIVLPKKDEDAINIVFASMIITFLISLSAFIIIFTFNDNFLQLLDNQSLNGWLYFIPLSVLIIGFFQSFNYWSIRKKHYKRLSINKITKSGTVATNKVTMGFLGFGLSGLIIGGLIGEFIATFILGKLIWKEDKKLIKYIKKLKIFALLKKYKKMPFINLPNALIDSFRLAGINILIAKFFSNALLGQFALAWRMVQAPMSVIGSSLSQVFFQKMSDTPKGQLHIVIKKFIVKAFIIALPIFTITYFFSVDIFIFIFGNNWALAGEAASVMTPWLFLNFITAPLSLLFIIINKQEIVLLFSILYMLIPISILILFQDLSFIEVLSKVTFSMVIMLLIFISLVFYYSYQYDSQKVTRI